MLACGADAAFLGTVLGDLAEERAHRAARDGDGAARRWYAREALRSAPHVARHTVRHVARHGTPGQRARLAGVGAAAVLTASAVLVAVLARRGPPAVLLPGTADGTFGKGLVVNDRRPVPLPVRVLDAAGRALAPAGVRYRWASGVAVPVTPDGRVTCVRRGDAVVRASLGPLATDLWVRCQPVREVRATVWNDFVAGDPARKLPVDFVGVDGAPVTLLHARLRVDDSTVATLDGLRIRPLRAGRAHLSLSVGSDGTAAAIRVFAPVPTLAGWHPERYPTQHLVAAPVRLGAGTAVRWPLPVGLFSLTFLPGPPAARAAGLTASAEAAVPAPTLAVDGVVMCVPALRPGVTQTECLVRAPGATIIVAHPERPRPDGAVGPGVPDVVGALALDWQSPR